jgi:hypothetical protein
LSNTTVNVDRAWRPGLVLLIVLGSLVALLIHRPIAQDPNYHNFADNRTLLGIPNFWNVVSNLPFLFVGIAGLALCRRNRFAGASTAWTIFFAAVTLVCFGSAYYHWRPSNETLVWDRLPMTLGFMAMFVALLSESIDEKLGQILLWPALLAGLFSVIYWHYSDDLRIYAWIQFMPLVTIPVVLALYRSRYSHQWLLLVALAGYVMAKIFESYDRATYTATANIVGGHALKHVAAAASCLVILEMCRKRIRKT